MSELLVTGIVCAAIGALGGVAVGEIGDWWRRRRAERELVSPNNALVNCDLSGARRGPNRCPPHGGYGFKSDCVDCAGQDHGEGSRR
jgi:hypothetical protein